MIIGVGTDIIEIERVNRAINNRHFVERVYTVKEQNYCESRGRQAAASYAARFAGKEAFFKALGTGIICSMTNVEILNDDLGCPQIFLTGRAAEFFRRVAATTIHISLSHSKDYAAATCVIEK
ncbi:MAG: holo-ACP synthase [Selenomonadaceae bacterium]|nr:holo-ACP synthase [Selenomonadaceae bacterium]